MGKNKNVFNYIFFSKEIIDKQFKQLQKELTPSMDYKNLMKKFHKILHNRALPTVVYDSKSDEFTIYRITDIWNGFNPNDPKCYSYNHNPKNNGRSHLEGFPVFYGSMDPLTAFTEMKGSIGIKTRFYLSRWKVKFNSPVNIHSLIINSSTKKSEHILNPVIKYGHEMLKRMVKDLPITQREGFIYSIEKMGDLFTTPGNINYHITSAYSHDLLYDRKAQGVDIPILMYPSVANKFNSVNWAIHPTFVDSDNMKLEDVFELSLKEVDFNGEKGGLQVSIHKKGVLTEKCAFQWKIPHFTPFEINFEKIKIWTYKDEIMAGVDLIDKPVNGTKYTVKNVIEENIDRNFVQANLPNLSSNNEDDPLLDVEEEEYNTSLFLDLKPGIEIKTDQGKSFIHYMEVPISWMKNYKSIEQ